MNLPLTNSPEESFSISIAGTVYIFRQLWNQNGFWTLDAQEAANGDLVLGVKIITKEFLLRQYPQVPFDLLSDSAEDPGRNNLNAFLLEVVDK